MSSETAMVTSDAFEDIVENFEFLDDWEDRYGYVIDLGKEMPALDPVLQAPTYKVDGCASQVWIVPKIENEVLTFQGDSDAMIVRGLIAVLHALYNGQTLANVRKIDALQQLSRLDLDSHLSAQRSNGLKAMIERLRHLAAE